MRQGVVTQLDLHPQKGNELFILPRQPVVKRFKCYPIPVRQAVIQLLCFLYGSLRRRQIARFQEIDRLEKPGTHEARVCFHCRIEEGVRGFEIIFEQACIQASDVILEGGL